MKNINFIIYLILFCSFYSCNKNDEETPKSSKNGYTFNSEFFPTDELIVSGLTPDWVGFFILDDNTVFNRTTGAFEGNSGRLVVISVSVDDDVSGPMDLVGTYSNVVDVADISKPGDFFGGHFKNISGSLVSLWDNVTNTYLPVDSGEVKVSFDTETEIFTLEYTLVTDQGIITGSYEGVSQLYELKDD